MSNWLDLVGDDSNLSMKSVDFQKCEASQLSNSRSVFDPELDSSQQGLPLLFKKTKLIDERSNSQLGKRSRSQMNENNNVNDVSMHNKDAMNHELPPKARQRTNKKGQWRPKKSNNEETNNGAMDFSRFLTNNKTQSMKSSNDTDNNMKQNDASKRSFAEILGSKNLNGNDNGKGNRMNDGLNFNNFLSMSSGLNSKENSASASVLSTGFNGQSFVTPSNSTTPNKQNQSGFAVLTTKSFLNSNANTASHFRRHRRPRLSQRRQRQSNQQSNQTAVLPTTTAATAMPTAVTDTTTATTTTAARATTQASTKEEENGASVMATLKRDSEEEDEDIDLVKEACHLNTQTQRQTKTDAPTFSLPPNTFVAPRTPSEMDSTTPVFPMTPFVFSGFGSGFGSAFSTLIDVSALPSNATNGQSNNDDDQPSRQEETKTSKNSQTVAPTLESPGKKSDIPVATRHNTTSISFSNLGSMSTKKKSSQSPMPAPLLPQLSAFSNVSQGGSMLDFNFGSMPGLPPASFYALMPVYITSPTPTVSGSLNENNETHDNNSIKKTHGNSDVSMNGIPLTATLMNNHVNNHVNGIVPSSSAHVMSFASCSTANISITSSHPVTTTSTNANMDDESGNSNDNQSYNSSTIEIAFLNDKTLNDNISNKNNNGDKLDELTGSAMDTPITQTKLQLSNSQKEEKSKNEQCNPQALLRMRQKKESSVASIDSGNHSEISNFVWGHTKEAETLKEKTNRNSWASKLFAPELKQLAKEKQKEEAIAVEQRKQDILIEKANRAILPEKKKASFDGDRFVYQSPRRFNSNNGQFGFYNGHYHSHSKKTTPRPKQHTSYKARTTQSANKKRRSNSGMIYVKKEDASVDCSRCESVTSENRSKSVSVSVGPIQVSETAIAWREKQITFGKNTDGYKNYMKSIEKDCRGANDPQTPDAKERIGKKRFAGKLHKWRTMLHAFDSQTTDLNEKTMCMQSESTSHD